MYTPTYTLAQGLDMETYWMVSVVLVFLVSVVFVPLAIFQYEAYDEVTWRDATSQQPTTPSVPRPVVAAHLFLRCLVALPRTSYGLTLTP